MEELKAIPREYSVNRSQPQAWRRRDTNWTKQMSPGTCRAIVQKRGKLFLGGYKWGTEDVGR